MGSGKGGEEREGIGEVNGSRRERFFTNNFELFSNNGIVNFSEDIFRDILGGVWLRNEEKGKGKRKGKRKEREGKPFDHLH